MHNENKVPLIRLAKRDMMEPWKVWCIRLASIVLALLLGGLVMMIALPDGATPIDGYATIVTGALGKKTAIRQTVKLAVPLLGCALAIAPCFKMRFWNIGAEGQITAGAIAASYFALYWVGKVPSAVLLLIMGLAGAVAGGIWALIPAFFKAKWNTNETLFTLMMNYIIIGVVRWLQGGPWEGLSLIHISSETNPQALTDMMVGHAVTLNIDRPRYENPVPRLTLQDVTCYDNEGVVRLDHVSFTAMGGEILGVAGIAGSGQRELLESIAGLYPVAEGSSIRYTPEGAPESELVGKTPMQILSLIHI